MEVYDKSLEIQDTGWVLLWNRDPLRVKKGIYFPYRYNQFGDRKVFNEFQKDIKEFMSKWFPEFKFTGPYWHPISEETLSMVDKS